MAKAALVYSDDLMGYDFGPQHPLRPLRLKMTAELIYEYGLLDPEDSRLVTPRPATEEELLLAHDADYIEAVKKLSANPRARLDRFYGFGSGDNPPFVGMYEASALYTGASVQAAELVMAGEVDAAFSIGGGLHHAHRAQASGFCIFNDPVVAIHRLLEQFRRVAYIDIDAHHGDGVQDAFCHSSRVMTISIHESGRWLFPGSGSLDEIGEGEGLGYSVNAPLAPYSSDAEAIRVFDEAIIPLLRAYKPEVLVAQLGADGHHSDPLTHLAYTSRGWLEMVLRILSQGVPVVALGGGGYDVRTVCRLWTLAYAAMLCVELPDEVPSSFASSCGVSWLRDDAEPSIPPMIARTAAEWADNVIADTRRLFASHGC